MKRFGKKAWILVAVCAVAVVAAVGGYAYWTANGSGTGNASTGSASPVTLASDAVTGLYPGGPSVALTVHVTNPGAGNQYVNQITGSVADNGGCQGSWFTVAPVNLAAQVAPGATVNSSSSITFDNAAVNQDACQNKTLTINWSSN
jgi:hypothetical protein